MDDIQIRDDMGSLVEAASNVFARLDFYAKRSSACRAWVRQFCGDHAQRLQELALDLGAEKSGPGPSSTKTSGG